MLLWIQRRPWIFLFICSALLTVLWLPGLRHPVVSDTVQYAKLGKSVVEHGRYAIAGVPYAAHLPLHAILSYPFTKIFGINLGMHLTTLVGGWAVLILTFWLLRRPLGTAAAALTTIFVLIHPAFLLMSMLGSADLTFTALLLLTLFLYLRAAENDLWYLFCGVSLGLLCLARYNGLFSLSFSSGH
jgi:4-amino-4-deoxy-L-arabinose transferase-like glycosyltransferase